MVMFVMFIIASFYKKEKMEPQDKLIYFSTTSFVEGFNTAISLGYTNFGFGKNDENTKVLFIFGDKKSEAIVLTLEFKHVLTDDYNFEGNIFSTDTSVIQEIVQFIDTCNQDQIKYRMIYIKFVGLDKMSVGFYTEIVDTHVIKNFGINKNVTLDTSKLLRTINNYLCIFFACSSDYDEEIDDWTLELDYAQLRAIKLSGLTNANIQKDENGDVFVNNEVMTVTKSSIINFTSLNLDMYKIPNMTSTTRCGLLCRNNYLMLYFTSAEHFMYFVKLDFI